MQKYNHEVHKYQRGGIGKNKHYIIYQCMLPNCTHYLTPERVIGKSTKCSNFPKCNNVFEIEKSSITQERIKLFCKECKNLWVEKRQMFKGAEEIDISEMDLDLEEISVSDADKNE